MSDKPTTDEIRRVLEYIAYEVCEKLGCTSCPMTSFGPGDCLTGDPSGWDIDAIMDQLGEL